MSQIGPPCQNRQKSVTCCNRAKFFAPFPSFSLLYLMPIVLNQSTASLFLRNIGIKEFFWGMFLSKEHRNKGIISVDFFFLTCII